MNGPSLNVGQNNFINDDPDANWTYGGQVGYLWHGIVGAEFIADFAPHVGFDSLLLEQNPNVNSYMGNAIGAYPFGADGRFQPYVSGGFGAIGMRSKIFTPLGVNGSADTINVNEKKWGGNIGAGMFAFADRWGVRGDVRWFRAGSDDTLDSTTPEGNVAQALLSDLRFWRGTVGVAFRW